MGNNEKPGDLSMSDAQFVEHKNRMQLDSKVVGVDYGSAEHETAKSLVQTLAPGEIRRRIEASGPDDWDEDPYLYRALLDASPTE